MKALLSILITLLMAVLEEPLIMLGILHQYNAYNVETGEYTTVSVTTSLGIGHTFQAPWYSTSVGCQLVVLEPSSAYILTY